jgi:hypothetical protein
MIGASRYKFDSIVGQTSHIHSLKEEACLAAVTHQPVLITGESGTGKELFAQAIHNVGSRRLKPFVRINCATIQRICSIRSCSDMKKTPLPGHRYRESSENSCWRTRERFCCTDCRKHSEAIGPGRRIA